MEFLQGIAGQSIRPSKEEDDEVEDDGDEDGGHDDDVRNRHTTELISARNT